MNQTVPLWLAVVGMLGTLLLGFLARFSMTPKERKDVEQKNYENAVKVVDTHKDAYRDYAAAMTAYCSADPPTVEAFDWLSAAGDAYFHQIGLMCDAILSGKVDPQIRDNTWLPKIKVAFEKTLPNHYATLEAQAAKHAWPWKGELRRSDHESIHAVVERYSGSPAWLREHED